MKTIHKAFTVTQDILGVLCLMVLLSIGTLIVAAPDYVGYKAWCIRVATEKVLFFEEPTDEQLRNIAYNKLLVRLHTYLKIVEGKTYNICEINPQCMIMQIVGDSRRNVYIKFKWYNPYLKKEEVLDDVIRIDFHVVGDQINPYPPQEY